MKPSLILSLLIVAIITTGCSGDVTLPVNTPDTPDYSISQPDEPFGNKEADSQRVLWGIWKISFDLDEMTVVVEPVRDLDVHYNITSMITPPACDDCLEMAVNSFDPVTRIIDVDVTLRNPYGIAGRDVRGILYTNDYGHELRNADEWTKLFDTPGGGSLNPFKAFAKSETNRIFTAFAEYTENYLVYIPAPPNYWAITYAVTASWPGNCKEPYAIYDFGQDDPLYDTPGATAGLRIRGDDWQDDIDGITLVAPEITGVGFSPFTYDCGNLWLMEIINETGAPAGEYTCRVIASSTNSGDTALYDFVTITVSDTDAPVVTNIVPDSGNQGDDYYGVLVTGENFIDPATVILTNGTEEIHATGVDVGSATLIACDISIPPDAELGLYDVRVTNPDAKFGIGVDLFEVLELPKDGWARLWGGEGSDRATDVVADYGATAGPVHAVGSENSGQTAFLNVFYDDGHPLCKKTWGDGINGTAFASAIEIIHNTGCVYIVGGFTGSVDFNPEPAGEDWHVSNGGIDAFLTRYIIGGTYSDTVTWGGPGDDAALDIRGVGFPDTMRVTGYFEDSVDFDPGDGEEMRISNGAEDVFLATFDSSLALGRVVSWGGSGRDTGTGVVIYDDISGGSVFVTGVFENTVDFDPGDNSVPRTSNGSTDCFLNILHKSNLEYYNTATWGGPDSDHANDIGLLGPSEVYIAGNFSGTDVNFNGTGSGSPDNRSSNGSTDAFLCSYGYSEFMNMLSYGFNTKTWGASGDDEATAITMIPFISDGYYITGSFTGTVDFDPGSGVDNRSSGLEFDVFITRYSSSGDYLWTRSFGADGKDAGLGIFIGPVNPADIYICGYFEDTVDFDPGPGEDWHSSAGLEDAFLCKFPANGDW